MVEAFVGIKVGIGWFYGEPQAKLRGIKDEIQKIPGVKNVYGVFGRYDIIALVEAETMNDLANTVIDKIRELPSVQSTETLIVSF